VQSFKKIIRRRFLDIFDKNKERRRLISYSIKRFVFKRLYTDKKYTYFKNFFFNKHFTNRILTVKKTILRKFLYKKKNNFIKNFKYLLPLSLKKKKKKLNLISNLDISKQLRSGDYFYSTTPNEFIDRYGFFREFT
jgi:midasin (ATPase involved in ribosome maturation)